ATQNSASNIGDSQRLSAVPTASVISWLAGVTPVSRSTIAPAASPAMARTFVIAADRVAAMAFSASAMRDPSLASASLPPPPPGLLATPAGGGRRFLPPLVGQGLCACARLSERLVMGCDGRIGFALEALRIRKVAVDVPAARLQDRADPRQRDPRHQQVERDE